MKRILLFAAVALVVSTAGAQMKSKTQCIAEGVNTSTVVQTKSKVSPSQTASRKALGPVSQRPQVRPLKISEISTIQEMKMPDPSSPVPRVSKAPSRAGAQRPFYRRPAGMFSSALVVYDGVLQYFNYPLFIAKPYAEYYWLGSAENPSQSTNYAWNLYPDNNFAVNQYIDYQSELYYSMPLSSWCMAPEFVAYGGRIDDDGVASETYQYSNFFLNQDSEGNDYSEPYPGKVIAADNNTTFTNVWNSIFGNEDEDLQPLCSSKTSVFGGRYDDQDHYLFTSYYGAEPWGDNE